MCSSSVALGAAAEQVQAERSDRVVGEEWLAGRTEIRLSETERSPARRAQIIQEEDARSKLSVSSTAAPAMRPRSRRCCTKR